MIVLLILVGLMHQLNINLLSTFFNDATVKDYSGNTIDNSSYHLLLYDGTCENGTGQGYRPHFIQTSSTVIEMTSEQCTTENIIRHN